MTDIKVIPDSLLQNRTPPALQQQVVRNRAPRRAGAGSQEVTSAQNGRAPGSAPIAPGAPLSSEQLAAIGENLMDGPTLPAPSIQYEPAQAVAVASDVLAKHLDEDPSRIMQRTERASQSQPTTREDTRRLTDDDTTRESANVGARRTSLPATPGTLSVGLGRATSSDALASSSVRSASVERLREQFAEAGQSFNFEAFLVRFMAMHLENQHEARKLRKVVQDRARKVREGARKLDIEFTKLQHKMDKLQAWQKVFDSVIDLSQRMQSVPATALGGQNATNLGNPEQQARMDFCAERLEESVSRLSPMLPPEPQDTVAQKGDIFAGASPHTMHRRRTLTTTEESQLTSQDRQEYVQNRDEWLVEAGLVRYEAAMVRDRVAVTHNPHLQADYDTQLTQIREDQNEATFWKFHNPRSLDVIDSWRQDMRSDVTRREVLDQNLGRQLAGLGGNNGSAEQIQLAQKIEKNRATHDELVDSVAILDRQLLARARSMPGASELVERVQSRLAAPLSREEGRMAALGSKEKAKGGLTGDEKEELTRLGASADDNRRAVAGWEEMCSAPIGQESGTDTSGVSNYDKMLAGDALAQVNANKGDVDAGRKIMKWGRLAQKYLGDQSVLVEEAQKSIHRAIAMGESSVAKATQRVAQTRSEVNGLIARLAQIHANMGRS